jgi:hypothetical protein
VWRGKKIATGNEFGENTLSAGIVVYRNVTMKPFCAIYTQ